MTHEAVSKRYAKALFEIGIEKKSHERLKEELSLFIDLEKSGVLDFLANPVFTIEEKLKAMEEVYSKMKVSRDFKEFFNLVVSEKRTMLTADIAAHFCDFLNDHEGKEVACVLSAVKLTTAQEEKIIKALSKIRGKKIELKKEIDPGLIGGLEIHIGGSVYDGTVKGFLERFTT